MFSLVVPTLPINETVDFWEGINLWKTKRKERANKSCYLQDWAESIASIDHRSYRLYPLHYLHENLSEKWPEWTWSRLVNLDGKDCFSNAVFLSSYQHHCGGQKRREGLKNSSEYIKTSFNSWRQVYDWPPNNMFLVVGIFMIIPINWLMLNSGFRWAYYNVKKAKYKSICSREKIIRAWRIRIRNHPPPPSLPKLKINRIVPEANSRSVSIIFNQ